MDFSKYKLNIKRPNPEYMRKPSLQTNEPTIDEIREYEKQLKEYENWLENYKKWREYAKKEIH